MALSLWWLGWLFLKQGEISVGLFSGAAALILAMLSVSTFFTYAWVVVTEDHLSIFKAGLQVKSFAWSDIVSVHKERVWNMGAKAYRNRFFVYNDTAESRSWLLVNLRGPIVFTGDIRDVSDLIDTINFYSTKCHFILKVFDQEVRDITTSETRNTPGDLTKGVTVDKL